MSIKSPALRWFFNMDAPVVLRDDGTYTAPDGVGWHDLGPWAAVFFAWGGPDIEGYEWWRWPKCGRTTPNGTPCVWFVFLWFSFAFAWYGRGAQFADDDDEAFDA